MLPWLSEFLRGSNLEALSALAIGTGLLISRFLKGFREGRREKKEQLLTRDKHDDPCIGTASDFYKRQSCAHEMGQISQQLAEIEMNLTRIDQRLRRFQKNAAVDRKTIRIMLSQFMERLQQ